LQDGVNCRLVEPGDPQAFEQALHETLADSHSLGSNARETAEHFSSKRYTDTLWEILSVG
jgi:glycosyltransferase involved in cell wall biosynthesis